MFKFFNMTGVRFTRREYTIYIITCKKEEVIVEEREGEAVFTDVSVYSISSEKMITYKADKVVNTENEDTRSYLFYNSVFRSKISGEITGNLINTN